MIHFERLSEKHWVKEMCNDAKVIFNRLENYAKITTS